MTLVMISVCATAAFVAATPLAAAVDSCVVGGQVCACQGPNCDGRAEGCLAGAGLRSHDEIPILCPTA